MISISELKFIRSLKIKKYRTAEKCFLVEGEKNVLELLNVDYKIRRLLVTNDFYESHKSSIENHPFELLKRKELEKLSTLVTNNQALAVVEMKEPDVKDLQLDRRIFVLDGIRDPGNLGTIIRTLDWFGYDQLICSMDSVDLYNPKVVSASMGSFFRIQVYYLDIPEFLKTYNGLKIGAEMSGESISRFVNEKQFMLVMGSESHGISESVRSLLDHQVTIPRVGHAESLNVGIATGILCHSLLGE